MYNTVLDISWGKCNGACPSRHRLNQETISDRQEMADQSPSISTTRNIHLLTAIYQIRFFNIVRQEVFNEITFI